ncbi:tRNA (N6-isopentenyl adenosine(37)-C2)-methylthiotransferase MiaB [Patescibacteria group bacterium]|nr:tRNA (N6-isopentenyl adenosine(37)-C2)-methylthiotransferase MiaB [Patescibacteria group bacterium]
MEQTHFYHIITLGCQMNKSDSERMAGVLDKMGLMSTDDVKMADVILMNSCSVRKSAEDRVSGFSHNFLELKKNKPNLIIGVTGCMPGRDKDGKLKDRLFGVDLYFPIHEMTNLPMWLSKLNPELRSGENLIIDYLALRPNYNSSFQAYIPIQTGCNHFCTYCVVPHARGVEGNRPLQQILKEVRDLASRGYLEITLLGQIVNHYIAPDPLNFSSDNPYKQNDFAKLLWEINKIEGIERVHFTAAHPVYMDDEVVDALGLQKQVNFLHLPVQSGNNEILQKMNRRHDREFFINTIKKIRKKRPDIAIATDLIVGFCGEDENQFADTVSMYRECEFDISYHAQYSEREGTLAAKEFEDNVPKSTKKQRWQVLQDLMVEITYKKNQKYIGKIVSVLVDRFEDGYCFGNSNEMKLVSFPGDKSFVSTIQPVKITRADIWLLQGERYRKTS